MTGELALVPSARTLRRWDAAAVLTAALFVGLGVAAGVQVWQLAELHRGLVQAADALDLTARAIALLGEIPLIGSGAGELAASVRDTAVEVRGSAAAARGDLRTLAVVIGTALAALALLPLLLAYVPLRVARSRELRGLRRRLAGPPDPVLVEHLARAALRRVPFGELRRISASPWRDVEEGRHLPFAAAELRRLGVRPPPGWTAAGAGPRDG
ncbi:MAG TPA: hypothetical protein VD813_05455 [Pseudonocardia sp.]|nr:hypothetical protein [Pseudonocardia sp.]